MLSLFEVTAKIWDSLLCIDKRDSKIVGGCFYEFPLVMLFFFCGHLVYSDLQSIDPIGMSNFNCKFEIS